MGSESRAVSEFTGVAVLVTMTVLVTASVGLLVLVGGEDAGGPKQANFSFQHIQSSEVLIVTHERGDTFDAGNLTIQGRDKEIRWHVLAGTNETAPVGPGETIQLSRNNAWDDNVNQGNTVRVVYSPTSGNETVLETWDG